MNFAEKRKKTIENRKENTTETPETSFQERRIQKTNLKKKIDNRIDTDVWSVNKQANQFALDSAERYKKRQSELQEAAERERQKKIAEEAEKQKTKRTFGSGFKAQMELGQEQWERNEAEKNERKQRKKEETAAVYEEALKRFQTDPIADDAVRTSQNLWHGLPKDSYFGDETHYAFYSPQTYYMTEDERNLYNYLLAKEGQKSAKGYLKYLDADLNERAAGKQQEAVKKIGEETPLRATAYNAFVATTAAPTGYLYALAQNMAGNEVDHNDPRLLGSHLEEASREGIKENKLPLANKETSDFLIDTGLSMTQNIARMPMGNLGLVLAAGNAATGAYLDAIDRGGSEGQALALGAAQGAAEAIFEKFSLENWNKLKALPPKSGRELIKNILKQSVTEGSEEVATEFTNSLSDLAIMKELSQLSTDYQQSINEGNDETKAKLNAAFKMGQRMALAGAGGAISGGIMGGTAQTIATYMQGNQSNITDYTDIAENIDTENTSPEQAAAGDQLKQIAEGLAKKQQDGKKISDFEKGTLENAVNEYLEMAMENEEKNKQEAAKSPDAEVQTEETDVSLSEEKNATETILESETMTKEEKADELSAWSESFGKNGQNAFKDSYDGETNLSSYSRSFANYYNAGRYSMEVSEKNKLTASLNLGTEQMKAAYKAGISDRQENDPVYDRKTRRFVNMVQGEKKTGGLGMVSESATESQKQVATAFGKRTGLEIEITTDTGNENAPASYTNGKLRISPYAKNFNASLSHELTHFIQDYSPDMYQLYRDTAIGAIEKADGIDLETMINKKIAFYEENGQTINRDQAVDEIVADATEKFLNDPDYIDEVIKTNRTLGEKILDFINDVIDALKSLMQTGSTRAESQALEQNLEMYEKARNYWMIGLEEAGDRYQSGTELTEQTKEKFAIKKPNSVIKNQIDQNFKNVRNMTALKTLKGNKFDISDPELKSKIRTFYTEIGAVTHPDIGTIRLTNRSIKDDFGHGKGPEKVITFAAVPDVLREGYVLDYQKNWKKRGYDTVVIGGKVAIANGNYAGDYYMGVIVNIYPDSNSAYLHEVYTTKADSNAPSDLDLNEATQEARHYSPINSIFDRLTGVNENNEKGNVPTATNAQGPLKTSETLSGMVPNSTIKELDKKDNTRFQLNEPVEETKNLIAVHNLNEQKLLKTFELEGIPMPSIAIVKSDIGHEGFGDISLLFAKDTIDPKKVKNKVYSADAWTPTFPTVEYEINSEIGRNIAQKAIKADLPEMYNRRLHVIAGSLENYLQTQGNEAGVIDYLRNDTAMKALYLADQGEQIQEITKEVKEEKTKNQKYDIILGIIEESPEQLRKTPLKELHEKYADKIKEKLIESGVEKEKAEQITAKKGLFGFGKTIERVIRYANKPDMEVKTVTDYETMNKMIENKVDDKKYDSWLRENIGGLMQDVGIANGKDIFTAKGERRSFKQTHMPLTAKNVVKAMLMQDLKNTSGFTAGVKSLRAAVSNEYQTIEDIKKASGRLSTMETYEAAQDELGSRLEKVMHEVQEQKQLQRNNLIDMDSIGENLLEAAENPTAGNIRNTLERYGRVVTTEQAEEFADIIQSIKEMPVNMFEAKPQRVVDYSEIKAAVIPDNASENVIQALKDKGVKTITYNPEIPGDRKKAVNSVDGIRFQLEETEDYETNTAKLIRENQELKKANELLKAQFKLTAKEELRQKDIHAISKKILRQYESKMSKEVLDRNLTKLYEYIRSTPSANADEISAVASDIARTILEKSVHKDTSITEQYKDLRKQIRETKISIADEDKADLSVMGGYNEFRKKNFGRMKLGADGISVDTLYQELSSQHPELFDPEITHPAEQLMQISNALDATQPIVKNPYHANMEEMSYIVGQELLEEYVNVRMVAPTYADRQQAELNKVKREYQDRMRDYRAKLNEQYKNAIKQMQRERSYEAQYRDAELYAQRDKINRAYEKQRHKKSIIKDVNRLGKWLLEPTDKNHIPQELRGPVAEFLRSIDFSSKSKTEGVMTDRTRKWAEVSMAFERISNNANVLTDDNNNVLYMDVDPNMAEKIMEIKAKVDGVQRLDDLDAKDLKELRDVVTSMKKTIMEINDMKSNKKYSYISQFSESVFDETAKLENNKELAGWIGKGNALVNYDMLDPQTMFGRMGPMKTLYDSLRAGLDKKTAKLKMAEDYFTEALEKSGIAVEDIRKWTGVSAPTQVFELIGGKIELSIPQIMSLYEMDKRHQTRKHMYDEKGGIKAGDLREGISWDNRSIKKPSIKQSYAPIKITRNEVQQITSTLTDSQKQLADAMQKFMGNEAARWGNEVSMEMYGYEKFTAKDYFPIKTDNNYNMKPEGEAQTSTIKNLGFTKSANKYANNPIIVEDIFDVFTRQIDQMSSYNAYVIPLSDLHKVLNYKDMRGYNGSSIKEQLNRAYGRRSIQYINKLIEDINGSAKQEPAGIGDALLSNMKAASVAANLRVAIQQPTAIARATAEINPKYLLNVKARRDWGTICKYAPIAQWKDWGFYRMQTARSMKDVLIGSDSAKQRLINKSMIGAELGDQIAWKHLWAAVENEIYETRPELRYESEDYFKTVGERFSEIVDKTQVADSTLHRTQIMRSDNGAVKMATAFMAEPLKSYNMLYRAVWAAKTGQKGAKKNLARCAAAYTANAFFTAVAASFMDAVRDDDRNKGYWKKYGENFVGNMIDNMNMLNNIPYVKDIISAFQGNTPKRTDIQGFQDIYYAVQKINKLSNGEGKYTPQHVFIETVKSISTVTGIPIKSLVRDAVSIIDTTINAVGGEADYTWLKQTYDIKKKENWKMYVNMMLEAKNTGSKELAEKIRKELLQAGATEDGIDDKINTIVNETIKEQVDIKGVAAQYDANDKASKENFQAAVDMYIEQKAIAGWDKKKCLQYVRSTLTGIYKPQYQAAKTQAERSAIIKKCKSYYCNGNSIYKDYDFTQWKK